MIDVVHRPESCFPTANRIRSLRLLQSVKILVERRLYLVITLGRSRILLDPICELRHGDGFDDEWGIFFGDMIFRNLSKSGRRVR